MKRHSPEISSHRGQALVPAIFVTLILTIVAITFGVTARRTVRASSNFAAETQRRLAARGAVHYAMSALAQTSNNGATYGVVPSAPDTDSKGWRQIGDAWIRVDVIDTGAFVNLNTADRTVLARIPALADNPELMQAIIDWRTSETAGANGVAPVSETAADPYLTLPTPYRAKKAPYDTVEELLLVNNMTPTLLFSPPTGSGSTAASAGFTAVTGGDRTRQAPAAATPAAAGQSPTGPSGSAGDTDWSDIYTEDSPPLAEILSTVSRERNVSADGSERVNINTANAQQLQDGLGISESLAARLIDYRNGGGGSARRDRRRPKGPDGGGPGFGGGPGNGGGGGNRPGNGGGGNRPGGGGGGNRPGGGGGGNRPGNGGGGNRPGNGGGGNRPGNGGGGNRPGGGGAAPGRAVTTLPDIGRQARPGGGVRPGGGGGAGTRPLPGGGPGARPGSGAMPGARPGSTPSAGQPSGASGASNLAEITPATGLPTGANSPRQFKSVADLLDVPRFVQSVMKQIADRVTVDDKPFHENLININTAPKEVLATVPGMDHQILQAILDYRNGGNAFQSLGDFFALPDLGREQLKRVAPYLCTKTSFYRVLVKVRTAEKQGVFAVAALVELTEAGPKMVQWRETARDPGWSHWINIPTLPAPTPATASGVTTDGRTN